MCFILLRKYNNNYTVLQNLVDYFNVKKPCKD